MGSGPLTVAQAFAASAARFPTQPFLCVLAETAANYGVPSGETSYGAMQSRIESLRVAYFMGKVEYIGLGGWNEKDAERHEALRHPANTLGFGALLIDGPRGLFTVNYARFVVGRGKPFDRHLLAFDETHPIIPLCPARRLPANHAPCRTMA